MDITIALCTWNRAQVLSRTLHHICGLRIPAGITWELIVVDNNCTDDTASVVESFSDRLPIRRVVEAAQGISNARNRALKVAQGDLLVFTDDDVIVDENWLGAYLSASRRWPEAGYFGGVITPAYDEPPPTWFREHRSLLDVYLGQAHDLGQVERLFNASEWPWGPNMAFRRAAFERARFRSDLGHRGSERAVLEERVYCDELRNAGVAGVWVPEARVAHRVGADRLSLSSVYRTFVSLGRTRVRLWGIPPGTATWSGVPRWVILRSEEHTSELQSH